jgi:hypothetical protein
MIVRYIQSLLQYMRQSSFGVEFRDTITGINTVIDNLVLVSRETLDSAKPARQQKGEEILQRLLESNRILGELAGLVNPPQDAPSKQRLAAAAYEVAKHTKDLVGFFESK